jgi:hypothetical protein
MVEFNKTPSGAVIPLPVAIGNNVVRGNDFGNQGWPRFAPKEAFIDGGGNVCAPGPLGPYFIC